MWDYFQIILNFFWWLDYYSIVFLMALESSIFPVPSEAVMIPAWYLVAIWKLNPYYAVFFWALWSLLWALVNYVILGMLIGKPFIMKYWKYILIKEKDYLKAESLFLKNDKLYTFLWRLIPVVRHLISIPAWIFRMDILWFSIITSLWAWIWCAVLVVFWFYFWESVVRTVEMYTKPVWIIWLILVWVYVYFKILRKK